MRCRSFCLVTVSYTHLEAEALLSADPTLAGYPILLDRVQRMFAEQNDEAFN